MQLATEVVKAWNAVIGNPEGQLGVGSQKPDKAEGLSGQGWHHTTGKGGQGDAATRLNARVASIDGQRNQLTD